MPTYNYNVTADLSLQTVVTSQGGGTNNVATVNILFAGTSQWSGTMIQGGPVVVTPKLELGQGDALTTIEAGSTFTLTVPTSLRNGNVVASMAYVALPNPEAKLHGQISSWTLSST